MSISREDIIRFVDGDLNADAAARMEARIAEDSELRADVARERELAAGLRGAFAPVLSEQIPPALRAAVMQTPVSVRYRLRASWREALQKVHSRAFMLRTALPAAAALACGLVIGIGVDNNATRGGLIAPGPGGLTAQGALADALDHQLASTQSASTTVSIGISFRAADGHDCRSFSTSGTAGLACHVDGNWQIAVLASTSRSQGTYAQAGSEMPPSVRAAIRSMLAGAPFDAAAERRARDGGWK